MPKPGENIRKRSDGRWESRFFIYNDAGEKKMVSVYGKTYNEAKRAKTEYLQNISSKKSVPSDTGAGNVTVKEAVELWLLATRVGQKPTTYSRYKNIMETHILPTLGKRRVADLTSRELTEFAIEKLESGRLDGKGGLSNKTVYDIFSAFKTTLRFSSKELKVGKQCLNFSLPRFESPKIEVFTADEQAKFEMYFKTDTDATKIALYLCFFTGLRLGEICALKWKHIDLDKETLIVESAIQRIQRTGKGSTRTVTVVGSPKTKASNRVVPLASFVVTFLRENRGAATDLCYVVTETPDKHAEPRTMQYRFERAQKHLSIEKKGFHSIRHTFATRCIDCGIDPKTLSLMLGHSNVNITLNRYVHPNEEIIKKQIKKLREALDEMR